MIKSHIKEINNMNKKAIQSLTSSEKQIWNETCNIMNDLLKDPNFIKILRKPTLNEQNIFLKMINHYTFYDLSYNEIMKKIKAKTFKSKIPLSEQALTYLILSMLPFTLLRGFERLKLSFGFYLTTKTKFLTLGQMLKQFKNINSQLGKRLEKLIDVKLRNMIAHQSYWIEKDGVHFPLDPHLGKIDKMPLTKFRIEIKKLSIIFRVVLSFLMLNQTQINNRIVRINLLSPYI